MARPNLKDGWFKLAYELLPAILFAGLRLEAAIVFCEVLAQTYGRGKRATAELSPVKIAARTDRRRQNISRGIRELVDAGILVKADDGGYEFVKDYEKWRDKDGSPLIDRGLSQYSAVYPIIAKAYEPKAPESEKVSTVDTKSENSDGSRVSTVDTEKESPCDYTQVSQVDTFSASPSALPLLGVRLQESIGEHTQRPCVCIEDRDGNLVENDQGAKNDPAEVDRVADLAEAFYPAMSFDKHVLAYSKVWPIAWVERALIDSRAWANPPRSFAPIKNLLQSWARAGGPPEIPMGPAPAQNGPAAAPRPSPSLERQRLVRESLKNADWSKLVRGEGEHDPR